nr:site-specific integrase [Bacteroides thetaiotaomicron]
MEKLITHLTNLRRSQVTIKGYRLYLSEFLTYLNTNGVIAIKDITDSHILSFLSSHPTNKVNISSALRVLFRFWKAEHIMDDKLIICSIVTSLVRKNISLRSIRQPK